MPVLQCYKCYIVTRPGFPGVARKSDGKTEFDNLYFDNQLGMIKRRFRSLFKRNREIPIKK